MFSSEISHQTLLGEYTGCPKKSHFQNAAGATLHPPNRQYLAPLSIRLCLEIFFLGRFLLRLSRSNDSKSCLKENLATHHSFFWLGFSDFSSNLKVIFWDTLYYCVHHQHFVIVFFNFLTCSPHHQSG